MALIQAASCRRVSMASQVKRPAEKVRFADAMTVSPKPASALVLGPGAIDKSGSGVFPGTNDQISNYDQVREITDAWSALECLRHLLDTEAHETSLL